MRVFLVAVAVLVIAVPSAQAASRHHGVLHRLSPTASPSTTVAAPSITISGVTVGPSQLGTSQQDLFFTITRAAGWAWSASNGCVMTDASLDEESVADNSTRTVDEQIGFGSLAGSGQAVPLWYEDASPWSIVSANSLAMTCRLTRQVPYKVAVPGARRYKTQVGASGIVGHRRCNQSRFRDSWVIACSNNPGFVTYAHTFPRTAMKGTRGMNNYWAYHVHASRFGRSWLVGRTVYQRIRVRPFATVRIIQVQWGWRLRRVVTRYRTVKAVVSTTYP
ncbi:MAG TPA: hypothetical protein VHS27_04575 [Gaiellales bacterium]|nr:hypothetical protein [Gaiellales bacterium]